MTTETDRVFGQRLQEARESRGWSMTELASLLGDAGLGKLHAATIGRMERGERPVRLHEAAVISGVLDLPLVDLLDDRESPVQNVQIARSNFLNACNAARQAVADYFRARDAFVRSLKRMHPNVESQKSLGYHSGVAMGFFNPKNILISGRNIEIERQLREGWQGSGRDDPSHTEQWRLIEQEIKRKEYGPHEIFEFPDQFLRRSD